MCMIVWGLISCCCYKRCNLKNKIKDFTILSIVLMLFLFYPTLVKLTLSMLKCPSIGHEGKMYLMADLQEPCFTGQHQVYMYLLTIPQLLVYVLGLPLMAALLIL